MSRCTHRCAAMRSRAMRSVLLLAAVVFVTVAGTGAHAARVRYDDDDDATDETSHRLRQIQQQVSEVRSTAVEDLAKIVADESNMESMEKTSVSTAAAVRDNEEKKSENFRSFIRKARSVVDNLERVKATHEDKENQLVSCRNHVGLLTQPYSQHLTRIAQYTVSSAAQAKDIEQHLQQLEEAWFPSAHGAGEATSKGSAEGSESAHAPASGSAGDQQKNSNANDAQSSGSGYGPSASASAAQAAASASGAQTPVQQSATDSASASSSGATSPASSSSDNTGGSADQGSSGSAQNSGASVAASQARFAAIREGAKADDSDQPDDEQDNSKLTQAIQGVQAQARAMNAIAMESESKFQKALHEQGEILDKKLQDDQAEAEEQLQELMSDARSSLGAEKFRLFSARVAQIQAETASAYAKLVQHRDEQRRSALAETEKRIKQEGASAMAESFSGCT